MNQRLAFPLIRVVGYWNSCCCCSVLIVALLLSACGANQPLANTVIIGVPGNFSGSFTPMHLRSSYDTFPVKAIYESLVEQDATGEYQPLLAQRWRLAADKKSITLFLRKDVRWHDGQYLNSSDLKFTLEFLAAPGFYSMTSSYYAAGYSLVEELQGAEAYHNGQRSYIDGIKVHGDYQITLFYKKPMPSILYQLSHIPLIAEHRWKGIDPAKSYSEEQLLSKPMGTGAYRFVSYQYDGDLVLAVNDNYWRSIARIPQLILRYVPENTAQALLLRKQLQIYPTNNWDPEVIERYRQAGFTVQRFDPFSIRYIGLNHNLPLLKDKRVRQALLHAINRQQLVTSLLYGKGEVVNSAILAEVLPQPADFKTYSYQPDLAIRMLEDLGWELRKGRFYVDEKPVSLTLKIASNSRIYREIAPAIQQDFNTIGIDLKILSLDFVSMLGQLTKGDFELFLLGSHVGSEPSYGEQLFTRNRGSDFTNGYENVQLDYLYRQARFEVNDNKRAALYLQIARIINEEVPWLFLFRWSSAYLVSERLHGVSVDNYRGLMHSLEKWQLD